MDQIGILILRVSVGLIMLLAHGMPKLLNFAAYSTKFPDPIGVGPQFSLILAIFSEVFCSLALIVGFKTRYASVPLLITMLVALFFVHGNDPWKKQEFVVMYIIPYLSLIFIGSGKYSLDGMYGEKG